jgi:RNA polymerase sigma-70 factor (ECF subfamily)
MRYRRAKTAARRVARAVTRSDELDAFETRVEVDRGLAKLTPRQRAAVVLTDLLGFSYAEAADSLHVQPVTVRKLVSQGRETLRGVIGGNDA